MTPSRWLVPALSITLISSWGSLFYAFAVLARPIQAELGWNAELTVGAYSLALLVSGMSMYGVGSIIDRHGGRQLMTLGSALAAVLFLALSQISSIYAFYAIWIGLGVTMAMTLYEPAFAVVVATYPHAYRRRITILTLSGGLASTVFWPLTHVLVENFGWRGAVMTLGLIHLILCVPLHWFTVPSTAPKNHPPVPDAEVVSPHAGGFRKVLRQFSFWLLTLCFMAFGFVTAAMAVHVIPLLESRGASPATAITLAALIGPMQVSGRFTELIFGTRLPALVLGAVTMALIPIALIVLLFGEVLSTLLYAYIVLYGVGLGLISIVRATTTVEMFGRERYASVSGALGAPSHMAKAIGPFIATATLSAFNHYDAVLVLMLTVATAGTISYWLAIATPHRKRKPKLEPP